MIGKPSYANAASPPIAPFGDACASPSLVGLLCTWESGGTGGERRADAITRIYDCWLLDKLELDLRGLPLKSLPDCFERLPHLRRLDLDRKQLYSLDAIPALPADCTVYAAGACFSIADIANTQGRGDVQAALRIVDGEPGTPLPAAMCSSRQPRNGATRQAPEQLRRILSGSLYRATQAPAQAVQAGRPAQTLLAHRPSLSKMLHAPVAAAAGLLRRKLSNLSRIHPRPPAVDASASPETRINLLLDAALLMSPGETLVAGNRALGKQDLLVIALEWALESRPELIPWTSRRLIDDLSPDTSSIVLLGISYDRAGIRDWAQGKNLPAKAAAADEVHRVERIIVNNDMQNVHERTVIDYVRRQLEAMADRCDTQMSFHQARESIRAYIPSAIAQNGRLARTGLVMVLARHETIDVLRESPASTLILVCSYVESQRDPVLKENLRQAMVSRLAEIAIERPCAVGIAERIADVPSGIDLSLNMPVSQAAINEEVAHMAARINEEFEDDYGAHADQVREQAARRPQAFDPEPAISEVKRDMLLHKARTILVDQRGLAADMVLKAVNRMFPENAVV